MKVLMFANTDWYLYNFRRALAKALRCEGFDVLMVSPPGPYGNLLGADGFRWIAAPMNRRSLNPGREIALICWLSRLLRRESIDVVHGFTIKAAVYGGIAGKLSRVPACVHAVAGLGYVFTSNAPKARLLRPLLRLLFRFSLDSPNGRLILQNPDDVELFQEAKLVSAERTRLIPGSGVDCVRFRPADRLGDGEVGDAATCKSDSTTICAPGAAQTVRPIRVLMAARLLWDKGTAEFIEAAQSLRHQGRAIEFVLAGEPDPGNPNSVPVDTVKRWVQDGVVDWLGHVSDMAKLYRSVDIVALPSYREGLPKGLIEAGACGCALVTTDVPGCREVVSDGVDGLLVPARDARALAGAIARLHDSPSLRLRFGQAARDKTLALFDEKIIIRQTLAVYRELLSNSICSPKVHYVGGCGGKSGHSSAS